jgi:hypothetical protein
MHLHLLLFPLYLKKLETGDTAQQFRDILKCTPWFFEIAMRSLKLHLSVDPSSINIILALIPGFFGRLCAIVAEIPRCGDIRRQGFAFTNQQLVLRAMPQIIEALLVAVPPIKLAEYVLQFIRSVRVDREDRKQTLLDKSKLKFISAIGSTPIWTAPKCQAILIDDLMKDLRESLALPHSRDACIQALAVLFLGSQTKFILQFLPSLQQLFLEKPVISIARILTLIAFRFPSEFSAPFLLKLGRSGLPFGDAIFTLTNALELCRDRRQHTLDILLMRWDWILAVAESGDWIDTHFTHLIYPSFSVLPQVLKFMRFSAVPADAVPLVVDRVLRSYLAHLGPIVSQIFDRVLRNHASKESNSFILCVVQALTSLAKHEDLLELADLFEMASSPFPHIAGACLSVMHSLSPISLSSLGEEEMIDRMADVINVCAGFNDRVVVPYLLWKLVGVHRSHKNILEEAKSLQMLFDYIPVGHTPLPEFLVTDRCKTGLDFYEQHWLRCVNLFQMQGYDELSLDVIQMIRDRFVGPLQYYELMPLLLAKEDALCQKIVLCSRIVSAYFLVAFPKDRSYVYRRHSLTPDQFAAELRARLTSMEVKVVDRVTDNSEAVQVVKLSAATQGEMNDLYWEPDPKHLKYHHAFHLHNNISLFKMEQLVQEQNILLQTFFSTTGHFPGLTYRLPIDSSKTVVRRVPANAWMVKRLAGWAFEIRTQAAYFLYLYKVGLPPTDQEITEFLEDLRKTANDSDGGSAEKDRGTDPATKDVLEKRWSEARRALELLEPYCQEEDHTAAVGLFGSVIPPIA